MLGKLDLMAFVPTAQPAKARDFYENALGLVLSGSDDYGVTYDVNGRRLRLSFVKELRPAPYSLLCWVVPEIRGVIAAEIGRARKSEARQWSDGGGV